MGEIEMGPPDDHGALHRHESELRVIAHETERLTLLVVVVVMVVVAAVVMAG